MHKNDNGKNIILCGLGGQGVVLSSDILADYFLAQGYDLKVSDIMGLGQRGGSVVTHIRYGKKILSPLVREGTADLIIAFEKIEAIRWAHLLKPDGICCVNSYVETPTTVTSGLQTMIDVEQYFNILKQKSDVQIIDIDKFIQVHNLLRQVSNIIMLGYVSKVFNWVPEVFYEILAGRVKEEYLVMNKEAFNLGRELALKVCAKK
ncbi:indolepyruvate ferredoxin oxidoreductase beta subunit [Anaerovirgula multivorans]|uniref:Indolepyruvate ferredoxin oxidoreductase beta subunit n=1 Tax=Anaerovirgula multivorans TaxID=312168 RepID=A0A239J6N6_9FIRM|nr:indolepyruvate oxidoreductase subunit beta [Anaerovirgula multivorans]SNT01439.1 indolepyruvate ferredoxin oxidoreductase beta subunit [Anaerovirgula multivorans]